MNFAKAENSVSSALKEARNMSEEALNQVTDQATKAVKTSVSEVDKVVHRTPWYFVGSAAAAAAVIGFIAGRKSKF